MKLESDVFNQPDYNQVWVQKKKDVCQNLCLWNGIMPRTKELSGELRKRIVDAHEAGKGYKIISKEYGLHRSTVRQIVYKWRIFKTTVTLPRSGRPTKITQEQGV